MRPVQRLANSWNQPRKTMKFTSNQWRRITKNSVLLLTVYALFYITPYKPYMLVGFVTILLITVLFRTVFCGWICPLGTVFDLVRGIGIGLARVPMIKPINQKYKHWIKVNRSRLDKLDHHARYIKYIFLAWILQAAILGIASIKHGDERGIESVLYILIAFLVMGAFIKRSWCRYACPVGALISLAARFSPTRITRDEALCVNCNICSRTCPMNIDVAHVKHVQELDCHTCIQCVEVCPVDDALQLKFIFPPLNLDLAQGRQID